MHKHPLRRSALALAALGAVTACQHSDDQNSPGPSEVSVVTLTAAPANLVTELPGRTNAFMMSDVRPQIGGIVLRRLFEEGSIVSKGQLLYQINPAPYEAAVKRSEEHTSELQSLMRISYAVFCLQKKIYRQITHHDTYNN